MQIAPALILSALLISCTTKPNSQMPQTAISPYCGCLVFADDIKKPEELKSILSMKPDFLTRSWFRWGQPPEDKSYQKRKDVITCAKSHEIGVGGGTTLSVINERDLSQPEFDPSWRSVNLDGSIIERNNQIYGSLSAKDFRAYLINKLLEQAKVGIKEFHLGEPNGEIHYDDWSLGLKGDSGFIQWLKNRYTKKSKTWWSNNFGKLGQNVYLNRPITRTDFLSFNHHQRKTFENEYGKIGAWNGTNQDGQDAFLTDLYISNLEKFLRELKLAMDKNGFKDVAVDVAGYANWMPRMSVQPDAYLSFPPDERWKLNWSTDVNFDLIRHRERIKKIMQDEVAAVKPVPVIYMFDHPKPFNDLKNLPDDRQAVITQFFAELSEEIGANFIFRSYSQDRGRLGVMTEKVIKDQCRRRKLNFCPKNN